MNISPIKKHSQINESVLMNHNFNNFYLNSFNLNKLFSAFSISLSKFKGKK